MLYHCTSADFTSDVEGARLYQDVSVTAQVENKQVQAGS